ncbi:hypothetical protein ACQKWADRAFT_285066 [Trichoderma austrokoningii]
MTLSLCIFALRVLCLFLVLCGVRLVFHGNHETHPIGVYAGLHAKETRNAPLPQPGSGAYVNAYRASLFKGTIIRYGLWLCNLCGAVPPQRLAGTYLFQKQVPITEYLNLSTHSAGRS